MNAYVYLIFIGSFVTVYCDDNSSTYYAGSGGGSATIFIIVLCCCGWKRRNREQEVPPPTTVITEDGQPVFPIATPIQPGSYSGSGEYRGQIISLPQQQPAASSVSTKDRPPPYSAAYYKPASRSATGHQSQHASNTSTEHKPASIYSTGAHSSYHHANMSV